MKPKTLNQLIKANKDELTFGGYTKDTLREEAIEWIKDLRNGNYEVLPFDCKDPIGLILWIKHFFGIKNKDIKEE